MTPRQQKEARAVVKALLHLHCEVGSDCHKGYHWNKAVPRLHDRARLWLAQTKPLTGYGPARRKKNG